MPQARKKKPTKAPATSHIARRLQESAFIVSILLGVFLLACLATYDAMDPGPFNTTASDQVQNAGRILGAWLANFFLFLTGYVGYLLPVIVIYAGWAIYSNTASHKTDGVAGWVARFSGLVLFLLSSTGLSFMHLLPPEGTMPAGGGGVFGQQVAVPLQELTGVLGSTLFLLAMMLVGVTLFTGLSWFRVMDLLGQATLSLVGWVGNSFAGLRDWFAGRRAKAHREVVRKADTERRRSKAQAQNRTTDHRGKGTQEQTRGQGETTAAVCQPAGGCLAAAEVAG